MAKYKKSAFPPGKPSGKGVKIMRQFNPFTYKTSQGGPATRFGTSVAKSKHDPSVLLMHVTKKVPVKRLFRKDPYNMNSVTGIQATGATQATFSAEADHFTNNPNPKYDPSKQPGIVTSEGQRDVAMEKAGKASRGHQNVIPRTLFNQNQGKRLRRV